MLYTEVQGVSQFKSMTCPKSCSGVIPHTLVLPGLERALERALERVCAHTCPLLSTCTAAHPVCLVPLHRTAAQFIKNQSNTNDCN